MKRSKSERITLLLSILCGLIGLCGIGHFYCRSRWKGLVFLVVGVILVVTALPNLISAITYQYELTFEEYKELNYIQLAIVGYFATYFLQIYDSVRSCRNHNLSLGVQFGTVSKTATVLMSERAKVLLVIPLVILTIIGAVIGSHIYKMDITLDASKQAYDENSQLQRSTPAYAENYQKWRDCIQNADGIYSHYSGIGDCGEDMLPPIYPSISQTQQTMQTQPTMQIQQTPQITQNDKIQVSHQVQGTQLLQTSIKQGNSTTNPSGATAIISTNFGGIKILLLDNVAPKTVSNFEKLSNSGYYDGTVFHRIIPGFVLQGGDPNTRNGTRDTWGLGNAGYAIPPEFSSSLKFTKYTVGMARGSDVNSGSSQFFITLGDDFSLNNHYTLYGEVVSGQDVVDKMASIQTDPNTGQPIDPDEARIIKIMIQS